MAKQRYRVTCDIASATGTQSFIVEASSPQEAIAMVESGEGTFEDEDVCVGDLDYPAPDEVELID